MEIGNIEEGTEEHAVFCREISRTVIQFYEEELRCKRGEHASGFDSLLPVEATQSVVTESRMVSQNVGSRSPVLSEDLALFLKDKAGAGCHRSKTARTARQKFETLIELLDDKPIAQVTREDMVDFRWTLCQLPANRKKSKQYRDKNAGRAFRHGR